MNMCWFKACLAENPFEHIAQTCGLSARKVRESHSDSLMVQHTSDMGLHVPFDLAPLREARSALGASWAVMPATAEAMGAFDGIFYMLVDCMGEELLRTGKYLPTDLQVGTIAPETFVLVVRLHVNSAAL